MKDPKKTQKRRSYLGKTSFKNRNIQTAQNPQNTEGIK